MGFSFLKNTNLSIYYKTLVIQLPDALLSGTLFVKMRFVYKNSFNAQFPTGH